MAISRKDQMSERRCTATSFNGWVCEHVEGHAGIHQASLNHIAYGVIIEWWGDCTPAAKLDNHLQEELDELVEHIPGALPGDYAFSVQQAVAMMSAYRESADRSGKWKRALALTLDRLEEAGVPKDLIDKHWREATLECGVWEPKHFERPGSRIQDVPGVDRKPLITYSEE